MWWSGLSDSIRRVWIEDKTMKKNDRRGRRMPELLTFVRDECFPSALQVRCESL